jgi:hypothetical protein
MNKFRSDWIIPMACLSLLHFTSRICEAQTTHENRKSTPTISGEKKQTEAPNNDASNSDLVKVIIGTSRPNVTLERTYGIYADIQNIGDAPIIMSAGDLSLAVTPELTQAGECIFGIDAFFPTEAKPSTIKLGPKEHYAVFWDVSKQKTRSCDDQQPDKKPGFWSRLWRALTFSQTEEKGLLSRAWDAVTFVPGDYKFIVDGKAYSVVNGKQDADYHTFTQSATLNVGISETVTIIAAAFGGILRLCSRGAQEARGRLR